MGQEVVSSEASPDGLPDVKDAACRKPLEHLYTRELLLSFADLEICKNRPESLDPIVWRDGAAADGAEGGIAVPATGSRGLVRRDSEAFSKSPVDVPEWRKDSWRSGGSGSLQQGPRHKPYDEEHIGNAFSASYPPRPAGVSVDNGHPHNAQERTGLQGQGSGRWEHRSGFGDRDRERGRQFQSWEDNGPLVPTEIPRPDVPQFGSTGPVVFPGWIPAERDGLLGSGGGLHRTYTGNFTTPSSLRLGPDRQMSLGPLDRQIGLGQLDRQASMSPLDRKNSLGRTVVKTNDPLHLPQPLKASTSVRREDTDFVNDETFGTEESSSDDRTEQERKRRESFELMRKEHQRVLQKQQKFITQKQEERLANPESNANRKHDERTLWDSTLSDVGIPPSPPKSILTSSANSEEGMPSLVTIPVVAPSTPRPAIPPGFAKVVQQMQSTSNAASCSEILLEGNNLDAYDETKQTSFSKESASRSQDGVDEVSNVNEILVSILHDPLDQQKVANSTSMTSVEIGSPSLVDAHGMSALPFSASEDRVGVSRLRLDKDKKGISSEDGKENNFGGENIRSQVSLLDKWFGNSKVVQGSTEDEVLSRLPPADEAQDVTQQQEDWSEVDASMSKFAQWFHVEENQSTSECAVLSSDVASYFPRGGTLLSSSSLPKGQAIRDLPHRANSMSVLRSPHGPVLPMPSGPSLEDIEKGLTASANLSDNPERNVVKESTLVSALSLKNLNIESKVGILSGVFGAHSPVEKSNFQFVPPKPPVSRLSPVFLTCEDIESSILAEAGTNVQSSIHRTSQNARVGGPARRKDGNAGGQGADTAASHHLLSLLHKGPSENLSRQISQCSHTAFQGAATNTITDGHLNSENHHQSPRPLEEGGPTKTTAHENPTLEALFGKAFMSELRSSEAPVSATFGIDYFGNIDATQVRSGRNPVSRQSSGRVIDFTANTNVLKAGSGTTGARSNLGWTENDVLEDNKYGHVLDMTALQPNSSNAEESWPVSLSGNELWGNGTNAKSLSSDGILPISRSAGMSDAFVDDVESPSHVLDDIKDSSKGKGLMTTVQNSESHTQIGSQVNVDGNFEPSSNFTSGQLRISDDCTFASSRGKVLSSDEDVIGSIASFDALGLSQVFKKDGSSERIVEDSLAAKFKSPILAGVSGEENSPASSQGTDSFLLPSQKLDSIDNQEDVPAGDKVGVGDDLNCGSERNLAEALPDTFGFIGKMMDGITTSSSVSTAGFLEKSNTGLQCSSSASARFKSTIGGSQPTSGFSGFQQISPQLQHQQSSGSMYRSDSFSRQQSAIPIHHVLQQNPSSVRLSMFPQQFHPQPGLPQQHLLARAHSNGSMLEYPHVPFGHAPTSAPSRPSPAGQLHFSETAHRHLSPPGTYPPLGHAPANQLLLPSQMPHHGPIMSSMAEAQMFMHDQGLHDLHGLGSKPVPHQGPALFPIGVHPPQSGQGPMFYQPLPHNLPGHPNQLLSGPGPWVVPFSTDLMRTASKGHELAGYPNATGVAGPGSNSLDRWFSLELARSGSGIPSPGLIRLSPPGMDLESGVRFG